GLTLVGLAVSTALVWSARRDTVRALEASEKQRAIAEGERRKLEESIDIIGDGVFKQNDVEFDERALQIHRRALAANPDNPFVRPRTAAVYRCLGEAYRSRGDLEKARETLAEGVRLVLDRAGERPEDSNAATELASLEHSLGATLLVLGRHAEAEAAYEHAIALWRSLLARQPSEDLRARLAAACGNLSRIQR